MSTEEPKRTEGASPEEEHTFHSYRGNQIPWLVHVLWLAFWVVAIYYTLRWLFPNMQTELVSPP